MSRQRARTQGCTPPPRGCTPPRPGAAGSLAEIVDRYIETYRWAARAETQLYAGLPLPDAIEHAALCKRLDGKRHSHQSRIPGASLAEANRRLQSSTITACQSFDELHDFIDAAIRDIHMIGALTVYDIAHRIGAHLGLAPKRVYLHSGTAIGARHLGFTRRRTIDVRELPAAFSKLSAAEIEDCLCIYKDDLARIKTR